MCVYHPTLLFYLTTLSYIFKPTIKKHPALARDRGVLDLKAGDDLLSHG